MNQPAVNSERSAIDGRGTGTAQECHKRRISTENLASGEENEKFMIMVAK